MSRHSAALFLFLTVLLTIMACNLGADPPEPTAFLLDNDQITIEAVVPTSPPGTEPPTSEPATESIPPAPSATPAPTATEPPASTPSAPPLSELFASGMVALSGPDIDYAGVQFTLPTGLADTVYVDPVSADAGVLTFSLSPEGCWPHCFVVRPATSSDGGAVEALASAIRAGLDAGLLAALPEDGRTKIVEAHLAPLGFRNGTGFRALNIGGRNDTLANNEQLNYVFMGLTDDGEYFVHVAQDVDAPNLLSDRDPAENTNENAFDKAEWFDRDAVDRERLSAYNKEASSQLQELSEEAFSPQLGLLDAWVHSLVVDVQAFQLPQGSGWVQAAGELDSEHYPSYGRWGAAFTRQTNPHVLELEGGGQVDLFASSLGEACVGYVTTMPDLRITWEGGVSEPLSIGFLANDSLGDATLVVNDPRGEWRCNDNGGFPEFGELDPGIVFGEPRSGEYEIWVGSFEPNTAAPGRLLIAGGDLSESPLPIPEPETPVDMLRLEGPAISYEGISFTLPPELGDVVYIEPSATGSIRFALGLDDRGYPTDALYVGPVAGWANGQGSHVQEEMKTGLDAGMLDSLPEYGAHTYLETQLRPLAFAHGGGFRALNLSTQSHIALAANRNLRYEYHGLTDRGDYTVSLFHDVDASILLTKSDPKANKNPHAFWVPGPDVFDASIAYSMAQTPSYRPFIETYNDEATRLLDELDLVGFTPDLAALDSLIQSLSIEREALPVMVDKLLALDPGGLDLSLPPIEGGFILENGSGYGDFEMTLRYYETGGEVDVAALALGEACSGYTTAAPILRIRWVGLDELPLSFAFAAGDPTANTSLIINGPDGQWWCSDDAGGEGLGSFDPAIHFPAAAFGTYDIWIAVEAPGESVPGELIISEPEAP